MFEILQFLKNYKDQRSQVLSALSRNKIFEMKPFNICGALRDLVLFVQFKKPEKHPWSVNFSTKINTHPWVFFTFFKLNKWYQIAQCTTYFDISCMTNNNKSKNVLAHIFLRRWT